MTASEVFYFATDALVKVATEDPACIPLRLFFDQQAHVLTTRQCYDEAFRIFARSRVIERKARISFDQYFDKVEIVEVQAGSEEVAKWMDKHSLDESSASLLAAIRRDESSAHTRKNAYYLVTNDSNLISTARAEEIDFHDYSEQEFCAKYGA